MFMQNVYAFAHLISVRYHAHLFSQLALLHLGQIGQKLPRILVSLIRQLPQELLGTKHAESAHGDACLETARNEAKRDLEIKGMVESWKHWRQTQEIC